jgi:hypothetical protein
MVSRPESDPFLPLARAVLEQGARVELHWRWADHPDDAVGYRTIFLLATGRTRPQGPLEQLDLCSYLTLETSGFARLLAHFRSLEALLSDPLVALLVLQGGWP